MDGGAGSERVRRRWLAVALAGVGALAFVPALGNGFVDWDDRLNFLENPAFRGLGLANLRWAWSTFRLGVYQPLGWMLLEAEYVAFGLSPRGYHAVSLGLHAVNTAVLFGLTLALLDRAGLPPGRSTAASALAVALFAVHPLRVEVVAWASCQPYLPCALFAMLSVWAYVRGRPALAWALYGLAFLSKAAAAPLPAVLMVLDVYPLRRVGPGRWWGRAAWGVYREKLPFLALGAALMAVAVVARVSDSGAVTLEEFGLVPRAAQASYGVWFYPIKTVYPFGLAAFYAVPPTVEEFYGAAFVLYAVTSVVVSVAVFAGCRRWPGLAAAWAAYLAMLSPNLGVVWSGNLLVADRYGYLAGVAGVVGLAGALTRTGWDDRRPGLRRAAAAAGAVLVVGLSALSWRQCLTWRTSRALWSQAYRANDNDPVANLRRALVALRDGRTAEARGLLLKVLRFDTRNPVVFLNLGTIALREGDDRQAGAMLSRALELDPGSAGAMTATGLLRARQGRLDDAERWHRRARKADPGSAEVRNNLGVALAGLGRLDEAEAEFAAAAALDPGYAEARKNLGQALELRGRFEEAAASYAEAVRLRPGYAGAHAGMGSALGRLGRRAESAAAFEAALRADPRHPDAPRWRDQARGPPGRDGPTP